MYIPLYIAPACVLSIMTAITRRINTVIITQGDADSKAVEKFSEAPQKCLRTPVRIEKLSLEGLAFVMQTVQFESYSSIQAATVLLPT